MLVSSRPVVSGLVSVTAATSARPLANEDIMTKTSKITRGKKPQPPQPDQAQAIEGEANPSTFVEVSPAAQPEPRQTKIQAVVALLRRPEGVRIEDIMSATGWQAHSVRGAMSGAIKKGLGLSITSEKIDGARVYRIAEAQA